MGCYDVMTYLLPLTQELSLLLQDLLVKLGIEQEAAAFPLHHGAAETTEALLEATLSDSQLKEETLRRLVTPPTRCFRRQTFFFLFINIYLQSSHFTPVLYFFMHEGIN